MAANRIEAGAPDHGYEYTATVAIKLAVPKFPMPSGTRPGGVNPGITISARFYGQLSAVTLRQEKVFRASRQG